MMIITCINCDKKFNVNSELIPNNGRTIQCGSCNHVWFFKKDNQEKKSFKKTATLNESILAEKKVGSIKSVSPVAKKDVLKNTSKYNNKK